MGAISQKKNLRTGLLGQKLGMTRIFSEDGSHIPVTLFKVGGNQIVSVKTSDKDGYDAIQLGFGERKKSRTAKPQQAFYANKKITPKQNLKEFRVSSEAVKLNEGDVICASHFVVGQKVDVAGITIGRGFAGVMKRHNFAGLEASHGVSVSHRSHGSTGQRQDPGRVFKGKKMAGHMGAKRCTKQNLEVILVDAEAGIVAIKGATPGFEGGVFEITDAVKLKSTVELPFPAAIVASAKSEPKAEKVEVAAPAEAAAEQPAE